MKHYKRRTGASRSTMKVDLKKAYDSISWDLMEQVLRALEIICEVDHGFHYYTFVLLKH